MIKRIVLVLISSLILVFNAASVAGLSQSQANVFRSGIYYFNTDIGSGSCSVSVDISLSGNTNIEKVYNFLIAKGLSPVQASGLMGNLWEESHFRPQAQQDGSSDPLPKANVGFGLAQWTTPDRQQALVDFAAKRNTPVTDLQVQLEFLWFELSNNYPGAFGALKAANDLASATYTILIGYEAPKDIEGNKPVRLKHAQDVFDTFGKSDGATVTTAPTADSSCASAVGPGQDSQFINGFTVYSQYDPAWANKPYGSSTIAVSGCGPSAMAMIITALTGQQVTPDETAQYAATQGLYKSGVGSYWSIAPELASHWGLKARAIGADVAKITATLQAGGLVITSGQGPLPFTSGGHFIVIRGVTDGKWKVGDSGHSDTSNKAWDPQELLASMNDGSVYAISK